MKVVAMNSQWMSPLVIFLFDLHSVENDIDIHFLHYLLMSFWAFAFCLFWNWWDPQFPWRSLPKSTLLKTSTYECVNAKLVSCSNHIVMFPICVNTCRSIPTFSSFEEKENPKALWWQVHVHLFQAHWLQTGCLLCPRRHMVALLQAWAEA